jgi:hypothetical protein
MHPGKPEFVMRMKDVQRLSERAHRATVRSNKPPRRNRSAHDKIRDGSVQRPIEFRLPKATRRGAGALKSYPSRGVEPSLRRQLLSRPGVLIVANHRQRLA